jgi:VanZ family protein
MAAEQVHSPGRRGRSRPWLLVNAAYAGLLVLLALAPSPPAPGIEVSDTLAHAAAYGLQALLLYFLFARFSRPSIAIPIAALTAVAFGAITEGLQLLQPSRSVEVGDLLANTAGAVIVGVGVAAIIRLMGRNLGG